MKIFALSRELFHELAQFFQPALCSADRHAFFALRIRTGLTRIEPVLNRAGEQPVGDVPHVCLLIGIGDAIAQVHGLAEGVAEGAVEFLHVECRAVSGPVL